MKKTLSAATAILFCIAMVSCSGKKDSAASLGKKWCELNAKVHKATTDAEKEAARAAMDKWENEMEAKYKGNEAFMKEVEQEAEKCEGASEGK